MEEWWALLTGAFQVAVMGIVETQESSMGILNNVDQRSKTSFQKGKKKLVLPLCPPPPCPPLWSATPCPPPLPRQPAKQGLKQRWEQSLWSKRFLEIRCIYILYIYLFFQLCEPSESCMMNRLKVFTLTCGLTLSPSSLSRLKVLTLTCGLPR